MSNDTLATRHVEQVARETLRAALGADAEVGLKEGTVTGVALGILAALNALAPLEEDALQVEDRARVRSLHDARYAILSLCGARDVTPVGPREGTCDAPEKIFGLHVCDEEAVRTARYLAGAVPKPGDRTAEPLRELVARFAEVPQGASRVRISFSRDDAALFVAFAHCSAPGPGVDPLDAEATRGLADELASAMQHGEVTESEAKDPRTVDVRLTRAQRRDVARFEKALPDVRPWRARLALRESLRASPAKSGTQRLRLAVPVAQWLRDTLFVLRFAPNARVRIEQALDWSSAPQEVATAAEEPRG